MPLSPRWTAVAGLLAMSVASCTEPELFNLECGDGRVDAPEVCDDGAENGAPGHCRADCSGVPAQVRIEGDVLPFLTEVQGPRVAGAKVWILEQPDRSVETGPDAHFVFEGLDEGSDVTLVVEHPDFKTTQTATITLGPNGVDPFSVQIVPKMLFNALSALVPLPVEEDRFCVVATTVARMGGSLYVYLRQGAAGASVTLDPPVLEESGPIYFNEDVLPDVEQEATSIDGGALYYRVPPGSYTLTASREDTVWNEVRIECRAGVIVNAGPPLGLLANVVDPDYAGGIDRASDVYSDASDAMCEATAACVNEDAGEQRYTDTNLASCQAMFQNTWSYVDEACDEDLALRDAARALYVCRTASCDTTLGADDVCVEEEAAFAAAQTAYGACLAAAD